MHLIVTSEELCQALTHVDNERLTVAKKKAEKLFLFEDTSGKGLREKYLYYIQSFKEATTCEIVKEQSEYIDQNSSECSELIQDPGALVGKHINHKFETDDTNEIKWYNSAVVGYDTATKT